MGRDLDRVVVPLARALGVGDDLGLVEEPPLLGGLAAFARATEALVLQQAHGLGQTLVLGLVLVERLLEASLLCVVLALLQKQQRPQCFDRIGKICGRRLRHALYVSPSI
ncbi:MAG TPA: hypothetical protein VKA74_12535 [Myxococcota bacterium]|nr:hypothetical protein [Myxococcota bacterium]